MIDRSKWVASFATVTECRYQFSRMNTLRLGVQRGEKFRIAFEYFAQERLYSGEFQSALAVAQGERIPIRYNPDFPEKNDRAGIPEGPGSSLLVIGVAGSVVLSLAWLVLLRGCR